MQKGILGKKKKPTLTLSEITAASSLSKIDKVYRDESCGTWFYVTLTRYFSWNKWICNTGEWKAKTTGKLHTQTGTSVPFTATAEETTTDRYHPLEFSF